MSASAFWRAGGTVALLALAAAVPATSNATLVHVAVFVLMYVGMAVSWNIFSGFSGYISLGYAVFFGSGLYTVAIFSKHLNLSGSVVFAFLPVGAVAAGLIAIPVGLIALRVRRHTFVVITIAIFFIFQLMAYNFSFTGGSAGILPPYLNWDPNTFNNPFYYIALLIAVGATVLAWGMWGSRFGLQLRAIRDDEDRARGLGVKTMRVKLTAFVISAVIAGLLGGLYFYFQQEALPEFAFNPFLDLTIALMVFVGGFGTLWGPVFGALLLEPYLGYAQLQISNSYISEVVLGVLFLAVILFLPRGILPTAGEKVTALRARQQRRAEARGGSPPSGVAPSAGAVQAGSGSPSTGSVR
jgi:branched-chain amino acid transport system permease protein